LCQAYGWTSMTMRIPAFLHYLINPPSIYAKHRKRYIAEVFHGSRIMSNPQVGIQLQLHRVSNLLFCTPQSTRLIILTRPHRLGPYSSGGRPSRARSAFSFLSLASHSAYSSSVIILGMMVLAESPIALFNSLFIR
jgi:hypothetical protein